MVVHFCNPSHTGGRDKRITGPSKSMKPYMKNRSKQKGWGMAQEVECLPRKCKALSSIVSHTHTHIPSKSSKNCIYLENNK
jgi:arginyl-tRNA--protein-N-Asp/Glu arginylyltransferase